MFEKQTLQRTVILERREWSILDDTMPLHLSQMQGAMSISHNTLAWHMAHCTGLRLYDASAQ